MRFLVARSSVLAALVAVVWASAAAQSVDEAATRVTFPDSHIRVELALTNTTAGQTIQVTAELLDPLNLVVNHASAACSLAANRTICRVDMPRERPPDGYINDLPRYRLRYTVTKPALTGILALDHISPDLFELHAAAPEHIRRGGSYTVRIRALHPLTHAPRAGLALAVTVTHSFLETDKDDVDLPPQSIVTDDNGYGSFSLQVPPDADLDSVDLAIAGSLANFTLGVTETLEIPKAARFDLTTDKPLYQPGQTVHTRLLLLDRNGHATAATKVRVDISDPDSTLVFRAEATTSAFGIATVDWPVPARMRLGQYRLEADVPEDDDNTQTANASIRLSRYDLPTFVVAPQPDRAFYLPGSNATVDVHADYLFGKPVLHGHVRVVREDDRSWNFARQRFDTKEGRSVAGELDAKGHFVAHIDLTDALKRYRGEDLYSNEFEDLHFAAYVTDASSRRTEQRRFDIRVTASALHLYLTNGERARGLPGEYYLAATLADGTPAEADIDLSLLPHEATKDTDARRIRRALALQHVHTDANGLARVTLPAYEQLRKLMPEASSPGERNSGQDQPTLYLSAHDRHNHSGAITQTLQAPTEVFAVHTGRSLYGPGEPLEITIDSAEGSLAATVQVLRHTGRGDLLLASRDLTLGNGHAALTLPTDARFSGLVFVQVIALGNKRNGEEEDPTGINSHAILFPRDNSLGVAIKMSADTYKPGEEATASLAVHGAQDPDGDDFTPAPSALGVVAVDQAVNERNRTDSEFGGDSGNFFFRSQFEFRNGRSAGGFNLPGLEQLDITRPLPAGADLAAEVLLSSESLAFRVSDDSAGGDLAGTFRIYLDGQLNPARLALKHFLELPGELPSNQQQIAAILAQSSIDLMHCATRGAFRTASSSPQHSGDKPTSSSIRTAPTS